jgi:plastocyanin
MRRFALTLAALALAVAIPAIATGATKPAPKTYTVKTGDNFFNPTKRTVHVNDLVKWVWVGEDGKPGQTVNEHTITESNDSFHSADKTGGTYSHRFKKAGKFTIFCAQHTDEMRITVTVKK